jgi:signal transduction histidine kinase
MPTMTILTHEVREDFVGSRPSADEPVHAEMPESITKVLILDNHRESAEELLRLLAIDGGTLCEIANDPARAMAIAANDREVSVIIASSEMPGLDVLRMIQRLRNNGDSDRDVAFIVFACDAATKHAIKAQKLGAIDFITTPASPGQLQDAVGRAAEALQLRRSEKKFRQQLEHKVKESENEARRLSGELVRSNQKLYSLRVQLSASNRIKSEFFRMISHVLKTPLVPILGFAELIAISSKQRGHIEEQEYCKNISNAAQKLQRSMDTMLDLLDVGSGNSSLNIGEVSITDVVDRVVDFLKPKAETAGIALTLVEPIIPIAVIEGDEQRIMQAIFNIVDNAIEHSPKQTNVVVEVHTAGGEVRVFVSDNGVGMNEIEIKEARDMLRRVEGGYTRTFDGVGLGLGLNLAEVCIELHGGKVNIRSQKGKGTLVEITIPISRSI